MSAYCTATVNEDGVIEPEVQGTRMPREEYEARLAKAQLKVEPAAIRALETLADLMSPTVVHLVPASQLLCATCGGDARWHAMPWGTGYCVELCNEHMQASIDKYHEFTRID